MSPARLLLCFPSSPPAARASPSARRPRRPTCSTPGRPASSPATNSRRAACRPCAASTWNDVYRRRPAEAVAQLHALALQDPQPDLLFTLAEISYLPGKRSEQWACADAVGHYYLCAGYAYHYLFACAGEAPPSPPGANAPGSPAAPLTPADAFDPRFPPGLRPVQRRPLQVHRRRPARRPTRPAPGTAAAVRRRRRLHAVGAHTGFPWKPEEFGPLLSCDDYEVEGLANQHHAYGLGVPLIAVRAADAPPPAHNYYPKEVSFPVTAFFRFDGGLAELGERRTGRLELYNPLTIQAIEVRGRSVPLETDLTTPLAYFLADTKLETAAYVGFLRADPSRAATASTCSSRISRARSRSCWFTACCRRR